MDQSVFVCGVWCRVFLRVVYGAECMVYTAWSTAHDLDSRDSHLVDADHSHEVSQQSKGIVPEKSPELAG
jgi:hypothetical protein